VNDGLRKRIGTAVVLGGGFLAVVLLLPALATYIVLTLLILAGAWEWSGFLRLRTVGLRAAYVALVAGLLPAVWVLAESPEGREIILAIAVVWWVIALVWIAFAPQRVTPLLAGLAGVLALVPAWLALMRLLMAGPNVLILDEPTNDLDIDTLTALEDLLDSFPGTVLVVSHDRYFVDRVCDSVVALLGDGSLAALPGGVEEYLARRAAGEAQLPGSGPGPAPAAGARPAGPSAAEVRTARKEAARLERRLEKLSADEEKLHAQLAAAATDHARVLALDAQLRELLAEKDRVETDWLAAAEVAEG